MITRDTDIKRGDMITVHMHVLAVGELNGDKVLVVSPRCHPNETQRIMWQSVATHIEAKDIPYNGTE